VCLRGSTPWIDWVRLGFPPLDEPFTRSRSPFVILSMRSIIRPPQRSRSSFPSQSGLSLHTLHTCHQLAPCYRPISTSRPMHQKLSAITTFNFHRTRLGSAIYERNVFFSFTYNFRSGPPPPPSFVNTSNHFPTFEGLWVLVEIKKRSVHT